MIILALMVGDNGFAHLLVIWPIGYLVLMATVVNCIALNAMLMGLSCFRLPTTENHWNIVMFLTAIWLVCVQKEDSLQQLCHHGTQPSPQDFSCREVG
jgi:hypothetical protein